MANELFFDHETNEKDLESDKSSLATFIIASLFGALGFHRFYTGHVIIGVVQLFTLGGLGIWTFIDVIAIATNRYEDSKGRLLKNYSKKAIGITILVFAIISCICSKNLMAYTTKQLETMQDELSQMETPLDNIVMANKNSRTHSLLKEDAQSNKQTQAQTQKQKNALNLSDENVIKTKVGLHILNSEPCEDSKGIRMVCGEVVNGTKEYKNNIVIKIHLFNANKKFVAITEDKIYSIAPGETWNFRAPIYYGTVAGYKIVNITSD